MPITMTPELAFAAGRDAGDRSMRAAGRTIWNEDDWNAASAEYKRLLPSPMVTGPEDSAPPNQGL